jgi:hypothetical protein
MSTRNKPQITRISQMFTKTDIQAALLAGRGEMGRRIGVSAGRRSGETDRRNGVSSINDEKTEDELEDDYDFGTKGEQLAAPWDHNL